MVTGHGSNTIGGWRVVHIYIGVPPLRDGFIVAKVAIAQTAIRCPQRRTTNSVANHEPEGPDFSRAKNSRQEAPPALP